MSKMFLTPINLAGLEVQGGVDQNVSTFPTDATVKAGRFVFNTTIGATHTYNGTAWISSDPALVANNYIPIAKLNGLTAAITGTTLNSFAAPTAAVNMGGFNFTALATPTTTGQAAEYSWVLGQVQSAAAGISSKGPVTAVATTNQTLSGLPTVDGVTLTAGQRLLLTAQTTASQNGPYVVGSGAWTRPVTEGATDGELDLGATWLVLQGTAYGGSQWRVTNTSAITPGTTSVGIVQFNLPSSYTASNGVTLASNNFSAQVLAAGGVLTGATGLYVDTTVVTRKYAATIGDGSTTSYTVTHNLNTQDVVVEVYATATPYAKVETDVNHSTVNTIAVVFATAPATGAFRVVVHG